MGQGPDAGPNSRNGPWALPPAPTKGQNPVGGWAGGLIQGLGEPLEAGPGRASAEGQMTRLGEDQDGDPLVAATGFRF